LSKKQNGILFYSLTFSHQLKTTAGKLSIHLLKFPIDPHLGIGAAQLIINFVKKKSSIQKSIIKPINFIL
jgi:hypothetical protein